MLLVRLDLGGPRRPKEQVPPESKPRLFSNGRPLRRGSSERHGAPPSRIRGYTQRDLRGGNRPSFTSAGPGRGSKPLSVSGSIRLRALLDGRGNASSRPLGLAPGESAVSPYPDGTSNATSSPYHRTVSFLLRSSDSRLSGSRPTPCFPERGLSSAAGRRRHGPPSAALHLLANERTVR